ncbi:hypothetical protein [Verrucomicrobium spinosum]|uniref:hypothetical protein n=1 Tax=Verrucomicrobium spinosum TaxID=2736 RepID=UPI0009466D93|nr:hypothetical protein [Verrucomicrobium spinosum]
MLDETLFPGYDFCSRTGLIVCRPHQERDMIDFSFRRGRGAIGGSELAARVAHAVNIRLRQALRVHLATVVLRILTIFMHSHTV